MVACCRRVVVVVEGRRLAAWTIMADGSDQQCLPEFSESFVILRMAE